jgi:hypothetical protein
MRERFDISLIGQLRRPAERGRSVLSRRGKRDCIEFAPHGIERDDGTSEVDGD